MEKKSTISIHALREEGDKTPSEEHVEAAEFLSTPSARRATFAFVVAGIDAQQFLSTPSMRRATSADRSSDTAT